MLKTTGIATILGLALMAGCATNTGSQSQDLATDDFDESAERCFHTADDYDGSDLVPPPISISIGSHVMTAPDAMVAAQSDEREGYARLLAEFVAAQVSIDGGAEIDSDDIDALIQAEDMLVRLDVEVNVGNAFENELVDLIAVIGEINEGFRIEAPCMSTDNSGTFEVEAPLAPRAPKYNPRQEEQVIVGASAEPAASSNGFHRPEGPKRPKSPRHWPANKASKRDRMR